tara:strand:- start:12444 stop:13187 length:744 start_codon:yes stop_codon:yes gene_type:complete
VSHAVTHYKHLLARHYTRLNGGLEPNVERALGIFAEAGLVPGTDDLAVDLGCGSGFQLLALARLGYRVLAIDLSEELPEELRRSSSEFPIQTIEDDLLHFERHLDATPSLIVCMGDSIAHLDGLEAIQLLFHDVYICPDPKGRFLVNFRDTGVELEGEERVTPVRSDANTVFTCFLEFHPESVTVNDLVYERNGDAWEFYHGSYRKVRLGSTAVHDLFATTAGFEIASSRIEGGFVTVAARKSSEPG